MRRLAAGLFAVCSVLSLLLCVAASVLWVRSYWVLDIWIYFDGGDVTRGTELHLDGAIGRGKTLFQFQRTTWNPGTSGLRYERRDPPSDDVGFRWSATP